MFPYHTHTLDDNRFDKQVEKQKQLFFCFFYSTVQNHRVGAAIADSNNNLPSRRNCKWKHSNYVTQTSHIFHNPLLQDHGPLQSTL